MLLKCRHGDGVVLLTSSVCFECSDDPALSLDLCQPAANPAALAMAILSSTESISKTSSNHQVPLVIISQPLPKTAIGQNGSGAPIVTSNQGDTDGADDCTVDLVLELDQISKETEESLSSSYVASLPVADEPLVSEAMTTLREERIFLIYIFS